MSSEPARRPEDDEARTATAEASVPDTPGPDEALPPDVDAPVPNPSDGLTAEAAANAEAAAAAEIEADPIEREAAVVTADAAAAETTAEVVATIDAASDDAAAAAKAAEVGPATDAATAADAQAERRAARRRAVGGAVKALLTVVFGVALLVAGIAIGNYIFHATRPVPVGLTSDPGTNSQQPTAAAQEFIAALAVNDADSIRSSLDHDPHIDLTNEMTKYGIQHVDSVDVLGTSIDGKRSATEILMHYQREDGIPFAINLVILVNDGKIEGFR